MMEKNKFMMIIIIVLLVAMMGTIVGVSLYVLNLIQNQAQEAEAEGAREPQVIRKLTIDEITQIDIGEIKTNLQKGADGKAHFVVFTLVIGYDNTQDAESTNIGTILNDNLTRVRSIALAAAYSKAYNDFDNPDGINILASEIKDNLQELFESSLIADVYIYEFLRQ